VAFHPWRSFAWWKTTQRGQSGCSCCAWRLNVGGGQWWNFVVGLYR
jgi:hypothetical protein